MYRITLIIIVIVLSIYSEKDTLDYLVSDCKGESLEKKLNEQSKTIKENVYRTVFTNDTITIQGIVRTNCCGERLVIVDLYNENQLILTPYHSGSYCFCDCSYDFLIKIPHCRSDWYRIVLDGFYYGGINDTLSVSQELIETKRTDLKLSIHDIINPLGSNRDAFFDFHGRLISNSGSKKSAGIYISRTSVNQGSKNRILFIK